MQGDVFTPDSWMIRGEPRQRAEGANRAFGQVHDTMVQHFNTPAACAPAAAARASLFQQPPGRNEKTDSKTESLTAALRPTRPRCGHHRKAWPHHPFLGRSLMHRRLSFAFAALLALAASTAVAEPYIYEGGSRIGEFENGYVYLNGSRVGEISGDYVYKDGNRVGEIDGDYVYKDGSRVAEIDGNYLYINGSRAWEFDNDYAYYQGTRTLEVKGVEADETVKRMVVAYIIFFRD
jgi:hypothetical protein